MTPSESYRRSSRPDLVGEIRAVTDAVDQLHTLLEFMWRNRQEIQGIVFLADHRPEPTSCFDCGKIVPTLADAVEQGWTELMRASVGGCKYAGKCNECPIDEDDGTIPVGSRVLVDAEAFRTAMENVPMIGEEEGDDDPPEATGQIEVAKVRGPKGRGKSYVLKRGGMVWCENIGWLSDTRENRKNAVRWQDSSLAQQFSQSLIEDEESRASVDEPDATPVADEADHGQSSEQGSLF